MQKQIFALAVVTLFTSSVFVYSTTDTPETRRREAERYLQVSPPKALFEDMADKMAANRFYLSRGPSATGAPHRRHASTDFGEKCFLIRNVRLIVGS